MRYGVNGHQHLSLSLTDTEMVLDVVKALVPSSSRPQRAMRSAEGLQVRIASGLGGGDRVR